MADIFRFKEVSWWWMLGFRQQESPRRKTVRHVHEVREALQSQGHTPTVPSRHTPIPPSHRKDITTMITGVHHVSFEVSDMERALRFYGEGFGFEILNDRTISGRTSETVTRLPGAESASGPSPRPRNGAGTDPL